MPQHNPLGAPLSIRQAAELIGCSAWTVRQQHVPRGLPCFRSGPNGKLIFYQDQVVAWIIEQQRKGGRW
jgi:phage terminase Nu1 subunit (DNA packaging protein)